MTFCKVKWLEKHCFSSDTSSIFLQNSRGIQSKCCSSHLFLQAPQYWPHGGLTSCCCKNLCSPVPNHMTLPQRLLQHREREEGGGRGGTGRREEEQERQKRGANSTRGSQAVSHPSTNRAQHCLTSVIGRELVYSMWYGRWREKRVKIGSQEEFLFLHLGFKSRRGDKMGVRRHQES